MDRASIHVVIVNWNSGSQLKECLQSFAAAASDAVTVHLTVVDNASADGSCDGLEGAMSAPLAIIRNADNRGFGAACNQGAAGADADFLLFLNPDTRLMPGSLELPARYLQAPEHKAVGIVGIQLLDADGHVARNTARTPTAWSAVGNSLGLDRLMPSLFPPHFVTEWAHDETQTVDQVMGAYFLVRRSLFEVLGGFDERFFVYYEDLDFSVRAHTQGFSSVYLATVQAFHRGQGTTENATERRMFYFARSKILYALKHFSAFGAFAVVAATLMLEPLARMLARPQSASETLRAFGNVWSELPDMLRTRRS
jgi:GT2 family glycosyltransferase